jgi:hypothetical protein
MHPHLDEAALSIRDADLTSLCNLYWCDESKMHACK